MKNKRPIIGIPGYAGKESNNFGAGNTYLEFINKYGDPRIIMPWEEIVDVDLLILPGGMDINPADYNAVPGYAISHIDVYKNFFFTQRLANYINNGTPIFGICLGMQQICVYFNERLEQDLKFHAQSSGRWETAHEIVSLNNLPFINNGSKKRLKIEVNSHHHQGVLVDVNYLEERNENTKDLLFTHFSDPGDNSDQLVVEAVSHKYLPIIGVQWHPEELYDPISDNMITRLLTHEKIN